MKKLLTTLGTILTLCGVLQAGEQRYDIVVYGGTSGAVTAAVQARRMHKSVVLISPDKHLGGLTSGGLGATDIGNKAAIGGLAREFYHAIWEHYQKPESWTHGGQDRLRHKHQGIDADTMWVFEPHVAEALFEQWVKQYEIPVVRERLDLEHGVKKDGARIVSITTEAGHTYAGAVFIDATYEGDLMAKAGVSYFVGREANSQYGETLNGVQVGHSRSHQFIKPVDPYVKPGDPSSGLLPGIRKGPMPADGTADNGEQAYNYRLCMTDVASNRRAWPKPKNYDEKWFELLLRNVEAGDLRIPWNPVPMPNGKTDSNNNNAVSTDFIGQSYTYPDADYATREKIAQAHRDWEMGLMWTLANNPRVPEKLRQAAQKWGLSKDEFADNDNWPYALYVREARRMVGAYVMTESNCRGKVVAEDPIALGAYNMDSHNVWRYVDADGHVRNEGDVQVGVPGPYPVSYRSITPKAQQCTNLLVPLCLSSTHIAFGSIRMEPVFMILGQSAATAAALAVEGKTTVQQVSYPQLRDRLLADKQVLSWTGPRKGGAGLDPAKLGGIVVDDEKAQYTGDWTQSNSTAPYVGSGYHHDGHSGEGQKAAKFTVKLPRAGKYEVRLAYSALANRATNVPITITYAGGQREVKLNERQKPAIDGLFASLGTYDFSADAPAVVVVSNKDADGHVLVDAVQFVAK